MRQLDDRSRVMLVALLSFSCLLLGTQVVFAQDEPVVVRWENGLLSVSAQDFPRARVLEEVSRRTGLEFRGLEGLEEERVSVKVADLPLNQALPILLGNLNFLFVAESASPHQTSQGVVVLLRPDRPVALLQAAPAGTPLGLEDTLGVLRNSADPNERLTKTEAWLTQDVEPSQMEAVLQTAAWDPEPLVRELALRQLRQRNTELWRETLYEQLKGEDVDLRRTATQLLAESPAGSALELLREATEDENIDVRDAAFQNLANLAEKGGLDIIRERLLHPDPDIRLMAIETMASRGGDLALEAARVARNDSDELVRAKAEGIIAELGTQ